MARILVLFASKHGSTRRIAETLADHLRAAGQKVELADASAAPVAALPEPSGFDQVVVGSYVHAGTHDARLEPWIRRHADALARTRSAFFSVSLSAAGNEHERAEARGYVERFLQQTAWKPDRVASFGGALSYTRYGFLLRFLMRQIAKRGGRPTDARRDYVYTDWNAVRRFAQELVTDTQPARPVTPAPQRPGFVFEPPSPGTLP